MPPPVMIGSMITAATVSGSSKPDRPLEVGRAAAAVGLEVVGGDRRRGRDRAAATWMKPGGSGS